MIFIDGVIEKKRCTGCMLCKTVCPVKAITFASDLEGFWYPKINKTKCILCGKCRKFCPEEALSFSKDKCIKVYAAYNRNDAVRRASTSGGVFYALACAVIQAGGVVAGCEYAEDWKSARHIIVDDVKDLYRIVGSKYFQSDTSNIYEEIKSYINKGVKVLFCGTPCQCAALRNYMGEEETNIITVEFICRGINSPKVFRAFLEEQERIYKSPVDYVQLKNKRTGWKSLATFIRFKNGKEYHKDKDSCIWVKGFIKENLFMRPSCYACSHRGDYRSADITIADFWGIRQTQDNLFKGMSAIMVNSGKGNEWLYRAKGSLCISQQNIQYVIQNNEEYNRSPAKSVYREKFYRNLDKYGYSKAVLNLEDCKEGNNRMDLLKDRRDRFIKEYIRILESGGKNIIGVTKKFMSISRRKNILLPPNMSSKDFFENVNVPLYIYCNYWADNIILEKDALIIPYKNAIVDMHKTAKIIVKSGIVEIGTDQPKHLKKNTVIQMKEGATWFINGSVNLFYNTKIEIQRNALFESQFFSMNGRSVIVCQKHIVFGKNVMIGRNVLIYDSDFHYILDSKNQVIGGAKDVYIEDDVWLTGNIMVQKGVTIERGCIIGAYTVVNKDVKAHVLAAGNAQCHVIKDDVKWSRERPISCHHKSDMS